MEKVKIPPRFFDQAVLRKTIPPSIPCVRSSLVEVSLGTELLSSVFMPPETWIEGPCLERFKKRRSHL